MIRILAAALVLALGRAGAAAAQPVDDREGLELLAARVEQALLKGDPSAYLALVAAGADLDEARAFADSVVRPGVTRAVVRERDRVPLQGAPAGEGYCLLFELFVERGSSAAIATWRVDARKARADAEPAAWLITSAQQVSSVDGLYKLALDPTKQLAARNLVITAPDFTLELTEGSVFVAETTPGNVTALVLKGRGTMRFEPQLAAERGQLRIFSGSEMLAAPFDMAFVRVNPFEYERRVQFGGAPPRDWTPASLTTRAVDAGDFRRAQAFFTEQAGKTFALNLSDLSRETWSLTPPAGDFLADVRTKRHGLLTYARSGSEAEDVTLFDRRRRKNISVYASPHKLATLGRDYDEDALADYDVLDYDVEAGFWPERSWVNGQATLRLKTTARALTTLTLRLAEALTVHAVTSPEFGRLLFLRVVGQNTLIINLPAAVTQDSPLTLTIAYSGRLLPQALEREAITLQQDAQDVPVVLAEPRFIYSNRTYWYPQSTASDYATATLRIIVPPDADCVGTGELRETRAVVIPTADGNELRKLFVFKASQPLRYLSCLITRLNQVDSANVQVGAGAGRGRELSAAASRPAADEEIAAVALSIKANPRQQSRGRAMLDRVSRIVRFYAGLVGSAPYPSFTLALTESDLPGGHSPAYFAILNQPLPMSPVTWRGDPVSFDDFPSFFVAHETAHQWWGQAVGWKNYHEQWLSEGFAQYFAALYAREERGDDVFTNLLRQMRKWALQHSAQGPVALGYRLGHIKGEGRVFRAIVYNKSAMVLHMLRRLIGDDAFFGGVRRFYEKYRFRKAGTNDLRQAMEAESGVKLERFFQEWIRGSEIPRLAFHAQVAPDRQSATLRFEHTGVVMDVPVLVTLVYDTGASEELLVRITERVAEAKVPLTGRLREIELNRDNASLAEIVR